MSACDSHFQILCYAVLKHASDKFSSPFFLVPAPALSGLTLFVSCCWFLPALLHIWLVWPCLFSWYRFCLLYIAPFAWVSDYWIVYDIVFCLLCISLFACADYLTVCDIDFHLYCIALLTCFSDYWFAVWGQFGWGNAQRREGTCQERGVHCWDCKGLIDLSGNDKLRWA